MMQSPQPPTRRQGVKTLGSGPLGNPVGNPSPSWREALKRSCLDRARKNRREAVLRSRGLSPNTGTLSFTPLKSALSGIAAAPPPPQAADAKALVEEELRSKGVSVFATPKSGMQPGGSAPQPMSAQELFPTNPAGTSSTNQVDHASHDHAISMDEVYGLLRDVEEEMQREEARLLEELQAMEQQQIMEQRAMEEQVAHYESDVTATVTPANIAAYNSHESLPCPVCNAGNLIYTPANVIICPNTDRGTCNLRLDVTCEGLTLNNFRELLCRACTEHSATGCTGVLKFRMASQFGLSTLVAGCEQCGASTMIV